MGVGRAGVLNTTHKRLLFIRWFGRPEAASDSNPDVSAFVAPHHDSLAKELHELTSLLMSFRSVLFDFLHVVSELHRPRLGSLGDLGALASGFEFVLEGL